MITPSMLTGSTLLTSRPGNGPFGFLFQSDAAATLLGQCATLYVAVAGALLLLAIIATVAERQTAIRPIC